MVFLNIKYDRLLYPLNLYYQNEYNLNCKLHLINDIHITNQLNVVLAFEIKNDLIIVLFENELSKYDINIPVTVMVLPRIVLTFLLSCFLKVLY